MGPIWISALEVVGRMVENYACYGGKLCYAEVRSSWQKDRNSPDWNAVKTEQRIQFQTPNQEVHADTYFSSLAIEELSINRFHSHHPLFRHLHYEVPYCGRHPDIHRTQGRQIQSRSLSSNVPCNRDDIQETREFWSHGASEERATFGTSNCDVSIPSEKRAK